MKEEINMRKIINPCKCKVYTRTGNKVERNAFVRIEYKDSKLSMSGVVAPLSNGDCLALLVSVLMKSEMVYQQMSGQRKCLTNYVIFGIDGI